ncbi:MAG: M56 family metallopeptidase [Planctomycetota bacterium]
MDGERLLAGALAWLVTYAVHGAVLCAVAWALGRALPRFVTGRNRLAAIRERLWKLAIFGGLATATLTTAGAGPGLLRIELAPARPAIEIASSPPPRAAPSLAVPVTRPSPDPTPAAIPASWMDALLWLWLGGVALGIAAWRRDRRRIAGQLRGRVLAGPGLASSILADLRARTGTRADPLLWLAPELASPISLGILRPAICIPPHAETGLMREELEAMLAHELAHVQRRDALLLTACRMVEVVFFVQPFLRFARSRLIGQIEIECDERAAEWTGDPAALASCLTEVATWVVTGRRHELVPAMAARGSQLEQRVRGLLDEARRAHEPERGARLAPATWALGIVPLAFGGIALDADRPEPRALAAQASPEAPTVEELTASARELGALAEALETEFAALAADPRLASAPERVREHATAIEKRIQFLRATSAQLDALLAEGTIQER